MAARDFPVRFLTLALAFAAPIGTAAVAFAQEEQIPETAENSKQSAVGVINGNAVYVHSGAGQNYYAVTKLDKGAKVTVVGIKFDWLKITPPEGAFSYVAKAFVERAGDGKTGRVSRPDLNVRAGSTLNDMKAIVQTKLDQGAEVEILGEKDEYFMIKPPAGAYCYVNKQYVDYEAPAAPPVAAKPAEPAQPQAPVEGAGQPPVAGNDETQTTETPTAPVMPDEPVAQGNEPQAPAATPDAPQPDQFTQGPTTAPATGATAEGSAAPTTQPLSAEAEFDRLEAEFVAMNGKKLEEQPVTELLAGYEKLLNDARLPGSMRQIADFRARTLKVRVAAREDYFKHVQGQQAAAEKRKALQAEREELQENIKRTEVTLYTAVGTLQTSSLQLGTQTLYRLTDPANSRTVVYVRSEDPKYAAMIGQFIGVKGELTTDPALSMKVISPTDAKAVDQGALYKTVAATVVPPSMFPKAITSTEEAPQQ